MERIDGYVGIGRFYDLFDNKPNIPFYSIISENHNLIADVGAGTGRISIPLALDNKKIIAIEPSKSMIKIFRDKITLHDLEDQITLIQEYADSFELHKKADLVVMSGVFDHFLSQKERSVVLANICSNLRTNGELIFDVHLGLMVDKRTTLIDDVKIEDLRFQRYIRSEKQNDVFKNTLTYKIFENEELIDEISVESYTAGVSSIDIFDLVAKSSFEIISTYGDYQFGTYDGGDLLVLHLKKSKSC